MTQEELLEYISSHPDGIMQAEVCKWMMGGNNGGYVSQQIIQLKKKGLIRRENVRGKWRLYAV
jgi:predicted transcriptional regulator